MLPSLRGFRIHRRLSSTFSCPIPWSGLSRGAFVAVARPNVLYTHHTLHTFNAADRYVAPTAALPQLLVRHVGCHGPTMAAIPIAAHSMSGLLYHIHGNVSHYDSFSVWVVMSRSWQLLPLPLD